MRRREFFTLLGGAAVAPGVLSTPAARAQQGGRIRRIGLLWSLTGADHEAQVRLAAFVRRLEELGWADGRNVQFENRWGLRTPGDIRKSVEGLVALPADVILATGNTYIGPLLEVTRSVPIVFALVLDPVGAGYVNSLARPGGNVTGFMQFEYSISGKWLELLKEIAPNVTRAAVLRDTCRPRRDRPVRRDPIHGAIARHGSERGQRGGCRRDRARRRGLLTLSEWRSRSWRRARAPCGIANLIVALAARHKLPAVYFNRFFVPDGGLISYGADFTDQFRQAAGVRRSHPQG